MKLWVMSDLHVDNLPYVLPAAPPDIDALLIAGDIADGHERSSRWLRSISLNLPVIFVAGNHDHFGHGLEEDLASYYDIPGLTFLHPGRPAVEVGDTLIVGVTLWTDYLVAGDEAAAFVWARAHMPDMKDIDVGMRRASPRDLAMRHRQERTCLEEALAQREAHEATVVITHHAPHPGSLRSTTAPTASDGSFASDLRPLIEAYQPAIWIHGHVHDSCDYTHGRTRIVCNPRGPVGNRSKSSGRIQNPGFNPTMVVEV